MSNTTYFDKLSILEKELIQKSILRNYRDYVSTNVFGDLDLNNTSELGDLLETTSMTFDYNDESAFGKDFINPSDNTLPNMTIRHSNDTGLGYGTVSSIGFNRMVKWAEDTLNPVSPGASTSGWVCEDIMDGFHMVKIEETEIDITPYDLKDTSTTIKNKNRIRIYRDSESLKLKIGQNDSVINILTEDITSEYDMYICMPLLENTTMAVLNGVYFLCGIKRILEEESDDYIWEVKYFVTESFFSYYRKTSTYRYENFGEELNWVSTNLPSTITYGLDSVYYGNGKYIGVCGGAPSDKAAYSLDGITWTAVTLPSSTYWQSVCYGNGRYVAVSGSNFLSDKAAYSTNGITWTASTLPSSGKWNSVCYGDGKFVVVAGSGSDKAAYSTNGITWTETTLPSSEYWTIVCYGNGKFVTVCGGGLATSKTIAAYSLDGITWTETTIPGGAWISVCYGNGKYVAVTSGSDKAAYSLDGITWTASTLPSSAAWRSVCYGDGKYIAVVYNSNIAAYSLDGITWTASTLPSSTYWSSLCYGNGKYIAVVYSTTVTIVGSFGINYDTIISNKYFSSTTSRELSNALLYNFIKILPNKSFVLEDSNTLSNIKINNIRNLSKPYTIDLPSLNMNNEGLAIFPYNGDWVITSRYNKDIIPLSINTGAHQYLNKGLSFDTTIIGREVEKTENDNQSKNPSNIVSNYQSVFSHLVALDPTYDAKNPEAAISYAQYMENPGPGLLIPKGALDDQIPGSLDIDISEYLIDTASIIDTDNSYTMIKDRISNGVIRSIITGNLIDATSTSREVIGQSDTQVKSLSTPTTPPPSGAGEWLVYYGGDKYVALSTSIDNTMAAYSTDGIVWSETYLPIDATWVTITYGMDMYIAIANDSDSQCIHSTDGITWTSADLGRTATWSDITFGNDRFIAINNNSQYAATSTNGTTWSSVTLPSTVNTLNTITYGNNVYIALGDNGLIAYSTNGTTWTKVTIAGLTTNWHSCHYFNNIFLGFSNTSSTYLYSTDGIIWKVLDGLYEKPFKSIASSDNMIFALANNKLYYSKTGTSWIPMGLPSNVNWRSIAINNNRLVLMASGATAAYIDL